MVTRVLLHSNNLVVIGGFQFFYVVVVLMGFAIWLPGCCYAIARLL